MAQFQEIPESVRKWLWEQFANKKGSWEVVFQGVPIVEEFYKGEKDELAKLPISGKICELGCGEGRLLKILEREDNELYGVDISKLMLEKARANVDGTFIEGDITKPLPFKDKLFDLVIIGGQTLGNITNPKNALGEAFRTLKVGGKLFVGVQCADFLTREFAYKYYGKHPFPTHIERYEERENTVYFEGGLFSHWFTEDELMQLLKETGFKNIRIKRLGSGLVAIAEKDEKAHDIKRIYRSID